MSKLRDNQALYREVIDILSGPLPPERPVLESRADRILDAVEAHLAAGPAHPDHLQGEAPTLAVCGHDSYRNRPDACINPLCWRSAYQGPLGAPTSAPTPTTTIIEPTPGPSHRPGGPPSPPPEPASVCTCFHAPEQHNSNRGCGVFTLTNGPCDCKYNGRRPAFPGGSGGGAAK